MAINNSNLCTGCMACKYICKKNAISFIKDSEGFLYPNINDSICIHCGLCDQVCPLNHRDLNDHNIVYAARNKNDNVLKKSSSGGVFPALCSYVFKQNGIVLATSYTKNNDIDFSFATDVMMIDKMVGSKYFQSYIGDNYNKILEILESGKLLLIVGTPCQICGIKNYIKKDYSNLILVDLICHGVASPQIWKDFRTFFEKNYNGNMKLINFRDKTKGWDKSYASAVINGKKISIQNFMHLYGEGSVIRPSCYECKFTSIDRVSDITIGDFWGIKDINPEWYDQYRGTSMILSNNKKGNIIISSLNEYLNIERLENINTMQMNLKNPTSRPFNRDKFWELYRTGGIKRVLVRYGGCGIYGKSRKILGKIKRKIKKS